MPQEGSRVQGKAINRAAYIYLTATMLFWGGNAIAGKLAVGHVSPMLLTLLRWILAFAMIAAFSARRVRRDWPAIRRHLPLLLGLGAAGFSIFNVVFYTAVTYTSAINVTIEQAGMPMVILLANFSLFRMRIHAAQIVGFVLSLLGVALTASHGDVTSLAGLRINFGDALMLVAVVLYGGYTVALRFKPRLHWQSLMTVLAFGALVTSVPFAAWEWVRGDAILPDTQGWLVAVYTAVFPALLSQVLFMRGVELIGANRAGLFINLVPIFGTLLAIAMLGEAFEPYHAIALVLVLGGISLAEHAGRRAASAAAE
jgi:drug/metabolite transporter (DMT)-like permease